MPNYTDNLRLEKPLQTENYNIDIFNANADKIDTAIQEVKGKVDGLELTAKRVSIADTANKFEATNVEDALLENKTSILSLQGNVNTNKTNISALQSELGINKTTLQNNINAIREVL